MPSIKKPIDMYCDNSAAIIFANDSGVMKGARHFLRRYHYVREQVESGEIKILKVHTDDILVILSLGFTKRNVTDLGMDIRLQLASSFMHHLCLVLEKDIVLSMETYSEIVLRGLRRVASRYPIDHTIKICPSGELLGNWVGIDGDLVVANVYAPQNPIEKQKLWDNLKIIRRNTQGHWLCFGDFNAIWDESDGKGIHFNPRVSREFNQFILDSELIEVPLRACLDSGFSSVLVNGSPTPEFKLSKGLRQGDQSLQCADDGIILDEWSKQNVLNLIRILRCF
ncbi:retrovirus-related pol polyprotein from transposon TNT 1-94 [Tanacetum coccineum]